MRQMEVTLQESQDESLGAFGENRKEGNPQYTAERGRGCLVLLRK